MKNVKKVNDEFAVAGQVTPAQLQQAATEGYKSVLNLRSPEEQGFLNDEAQQAAAVGLEYINIPVNPNGMTDELTDNVLAQIDTLPKPTLIHCASSMRAGAIALMDVAIRQNMTAEQAFEKAAQVGVDFDANPAIKQFVEHYVSTHSKES